MPCVGHRIAAKRAQAFEVECNSFLPLIQGDIQALVERWNKVKQEHETNQDGQKLHEGQLQVSKDFKEWLSKRTRRCDLKAKTKAFRQWLNERKSQAKKADKAAAQSSWNDASPRCWVVLAPGFWHSCLKQA